MLVDNPLLQPSFFEAASTQSSCTDFSDFFDTDLFNNAFAATSSQGSTPQHLLTPSQELLPTSFPEIHDDNDFYALFDENFGSATGGVKYDSGYGMGMDMSNMGMNIPSIDDPMQIRGIDPQLVDTPSAVSDHDDEAKEEQPPSPAEVVERPEQEKIILTIAPVKVGGFGKARKGTVQSGGVVKKTPNTYANKEKDGLSNPASSTKVTKPSLTAPANTTLGLPLTGDNSTTGGSEAGDRDDDDDLPQDWRPSPEVLAKMTSKEKRQLRNKISARNFRVRRKEYISTLEGDVAERDRLLDHFRTKLGSQESENLALRQEIAALKKALLDGRGGPISLPPPAALPEYSAAEALATSNTNINTVRTPQLLTANTQKDLPTSPRLGGPRFWGGVGMGSGVTPVHTTLVPDISTIVKNGLQENMNPSLNVLRGGIIGNEIGPNKSLGPVGFDGFADLNPFTLKTLDAYRMHLWGKMAAQQIHQQQNQASQTQQNFSGSVSNMRPHFFAASPKPNLSPSYGTTLSALLSGKHNAPYSHSSSTSSYPTPPTSPLFHPKGVASLPLPLLHSLGSSQSPSATPSSSLSSQKERHKEQQYAMLAAMASQTIFRKLGNAFWDAFTGSSSSCSSSSSASSSRGDWDADKVRKVLEGKAVLRVVDVEPTTISAAASTSVTSTLNITTPPASPKMHHLRTGATSRSSLSQLPQATKDCSKSSCKSAACEMLEESMRSLSLGKKIC